jgi:mechanosensitive ion channel-like protein
MWTSVRGTFDDAFSRVLTAVARFLPGVALMLLVMGFSVLVALLVRFALRRSLAGVDFDRRVHRWGLTSTGEWTPKNAPTAIVAHAGFWFVLLVGFLAGLQGLETRVTDAIATRTLAWIPNLLGAILIFAAGLAIARFLERTALISAVNMQIQQARLLSLGVKWLVVLLSAALALQEMNVGGAILTVSFAIVFGGIVLALALAVGLGSRDAVSRGWEKSFQEERHVEERDEIRHM